MLRQTCRPPSAEAEKRTTGFLSMLAERFRESAGDRATQNSLVVLPFANLGATEVAPLYGFALADAIAARLARIPALVVRPSSTLMSLPIAQMDPLSVGQKLLVSLCAGGQFSALRKRLRSELATARCGLAERALRRRHSRGLARSDCGADRDFKRGVCRAAWPRRRRPDGLRPAPAAPRRLAARSGERGVSAGARAAQFVHGAHRLAADLDRAHALFTSVTTKDPEFAAGWSGLGIAELQYVRHGFGGQIHVMHARRAFDEALKLDPASTEANLYRIYMLLSRGEKESARHGIANLLAGAANDWNVHMVAGIALRGDGMYDEALAEFSRALKLNPANAAILYNHRARVYHYQNQIELAGDELEKGLALEPRHPLLRTSAGYQQMRMGNLPAAIRFSKA